MADQYARQYQMPLNFTFGLYEKFISICPDNIWGEKFGGFPVCQQIYHSLWATGMMLASINGHQVVEPIPQFGPLNADNKAMPSKADCSSLLAGLKQALKMLMEELADESLLQKNEGLSKKMGRDVTNGEVLEFAALHCSYHLGSCDAALRNHNLEGSW